MLQTKVVAEFVCHARHAGAGVATVIERTGIRVGENADVAITTDDIVTHGIPSFGCAGFDRSDIDIEHGEVLRDLFPCIRNIILFGCIKGRAVSVFAIGLSAGRRIAIEIQKDRRRRTRQAIQNRHPVGKRGEGDRLLAVVA